MNFLNIPTFLFYFPLLLLFSFTPLLAVIEAQLGYLPGAVERQLLALLNLLVSTICINPYVLILIIIIFAICGLLFLFILI